MVASKITPLIYCGRRTMEEQAGLYAKGRNEARQDRDQGQAGPELPQLRPSV
jgi:hypothetical protein